MPWPRRLPHFTHVKRKRSAQIIPFRRRANDNIPLPVELRRSRVPSKTQRSSLLSLSVLLPRTVASRASREIYTYVHPRQVRHFTKKVRVPLPKVERRRYVRTKVRVRVPVPLPRALGSHVTVEPDRLTVGSTRQLWRALVPGRLANRKALDEKGNRRKARYGQLDSPGATGFGSVAAHAQRGHSIKQIADAAMVARAIGVRHGFQFPY